MAASKWYPGRRVGWRKLSASYRGRLERQGVSRSAWESGADLRSARGKKPPTPSYAAPAEPTHRYVGGYGTDADRRALALWRATLAPGWLPSPLWMSDDTAAALSRLRAGPQQWRRIDLYPHDGDPWELVVQFRRGYAQTIEIPNESASEVLMLLSQSQAGIAREGHRDEYQNLGIRDAEAWNRWIEDGRNFDVHGTT